MPRPPRSVPREGCPNWSAEYDFDASLFELPDVAIAVAFARNLRHAMGGRSGREIGRLTGVDFTAINKILRGQTWPDMRTIALLEAGLGVDLWPRGVAQEVSDEERDSA